MRVLGALLLCGVVALAGLTSVDAGGAKEVTLKGLIGCPKCEFGVAQSCSTAIQVKEGGKEILVHFDTAGNKKFHDEICSGAKKGTVTGTVMTVKDKKTITVKTVSFD